MNRRDVLKTGAAAILGAGFVRSAEGLLIPSREIITNPSPLYYSATGLVRSIEFTVHNGGLHTMKMELYCDKVTQHCSIHEAGFEMGRPMRVDLSGG